MRTAIAAESERSQRILVCDHERHVVRLIQVNLERQGHTVDCAFDGDEAIRLLEEHEYDRVVLDVMMPGRDGTEVLRWIRTNPKRERLWVALMISRAQDRELWEKRANQPDRYLTKPFNPLDLLR